MGKSTISMAIFNSYVCLPEGGWSNKHRTGVHHPRREIGVSWMILSSPRQVRLASGCWRRSKLPAKEKKPWNDPFGKWKKNNHSNPKTGGFSIEFYDIFYFAIVSPSGSWKVPWNIMEYGTSWMTFITPKLLEVIVNGFLFPYSLYMELTLVGVIINSTNKERNLEPKT